MDEDLNQLQRMFDQNLTQNHMLLISTPQSSYHQGHFNSIYYPQQKNVDQDNFFSRSPNPFECESKNSLECHQQVKPLENWQNEFQEEKMSDFEEVQSSQEFFMEKKSSQILYEQSSTEFKNKQSSFYSGKQIKKGKNNRNFEQRARKQFQSQSQPQQDSQEFEISSCKKQGSLKNLSQIMFQIIHKCDNLTFGSVAIKMVKYFSKKMAKKGEKIEESRVKNIKRRVYDALNVMISLGIVEKFGKRIRVKERVKSQKGKKQSLNMKKRHRNSNNIKEISHKLDEYTARLQFKRKQLKLLEQRKEHLHKFFTERSQSSQITNESGIIKFPFVCISTKSSSACQINQVQKQKCDQLWEKDNSLTCDTYREDDYVTIVFGTQDMFRGISVQGDVDFVERIGKLSGAMEE